MLCKAHVIHTWQISQLLNSASCYREYLVSQQRIWCCMLGIHCFPRWYFQVTCRECFVSQGSIFKWHAVFQHGIWSSMLGIPCFPIWNLMLHAGNALFPNLEFDVACWEYIVSLGGIFMCHAENTLFPNSESDVACWECFVSQLGIWCCMLGIHCFPRWYLQVSCWSTLFSKVVFSSGMLGILCFPPWNPFSHARIHCFPRWYFQMTRWEFFVSQLGICSHMLGIHCFPRWYFQVTCWEYLVSQLGILGCIQQIPPVVGWSVATVHNAVVPSVLELLAGVAALWLHLGAHFCNFLQLLPCISVCCWDHLQEACWLHLARLLQSHASWKP